MPCHITQRGVDRRETFSSDQDRTTYLRLLQANLQDAQASLLGWCLMTNHVHLIAVPERADSLAVLLRRVHGRYAQYYNTRSGRTGHLWQNRFFACLLERDHLWTALAYVDRNPLRAGMVQWAADYRWSSAAAHLSRVDEIGILDVEWWLREGRGQIGIRFWARRNGRPLPRCGAARMRDGATRALSARYRSDSGGIGNVAGQRKSQWPLTGLKNPGISGHSFEEAASKNFAQFRLTHFARPILLHFARPSKACLVSTPDARMRPSLYRRF
jgi:REP element-mobilizing transposase RayT